MANKALKSLKFPGLNDTYTIPEIDSTLSTTGKAADSKATGDAIAAVNTKIGKLEKLEITDTASGAIASFPDGADNMPIKSLVVDIAPVQDLHGYANPWPAGGGVNKLPPAASGTASNRGVTLISDGNGGYSISGTSESGGAANVSFVLSGTYTIQNGDYFYLGNSVANASISVNMETADGTTLFYWGNSPANRIVDISSHAGEVVGKIRIYVTSGTQTSGTFKPMICSVNSLTSFVPYSNICPISGWTGADVTAAGKNIAKLAYGNQVPSVATGNMVSSNGWSSDFTPIDNTQSYTMTNGNGQAYVLFYGASKNYLGYKQLAVESCQLSTFAQYASAYYIKLRSDNVQGITPEIQLEHGNATAYEAYNGTTYPVTWSDEAGTVYGGTVDVTNGNVKKTMEIVDLGDLTWTKSTSGGKTFFYGAINGIKKVDSASKTINMICSQYINVAMSVWSTTNLCVFKNSGATNSNVSIRDDALSDLTAEQFAAAMDGVQLCYELATPSDFSTTPATDLVTQYGDNNVWNDCGDTTVEYVADTKLYINKIVAALA